MHTLIIRHVGDEAERYRFQVERLRDGKRGDATTLTAPEAIQVQGRPDSNLSLDLRWYLEEFLEYPFAPNTGVAERIRSALEDWGQQAFQGLFSGNALLCTTTPTGRGWSI